MPRRILILKFGGMGEAVLARSIVEHLRARNPGIEIEFVADPRTREVMTCPSGAHHAVVYDPGRDGIPGALRTLTRIRARGYDAAVDFEQTSLLTAAFLRVAGIPVRVGFVPPDDDTRRVFLTHPIELREKESMWTNMSRIARVLDPTLPVDLSVVPPPISAEATRKVDDWWRQNIPAAASRVVAMHLGVGPSAQYRRWPIEYFATVARELRRRVSDLMIVLTGDISERGMAREFSAKYARPTAYALGFSSIERTAVLLSHCDLLISSDTGVMHLGAAMGTPTVGMFGPNTPRCWAPVGPRATYVCGATLPCSPCINSYRRIIPESCRLSPPGRCMLDIDPRHVLTAARRVIRGNWLDGSYSDGVPVNLVEKEMADANR